jgi:[protein-PII] uridylyltransferase
MDALALSRSLLEGSWVEPDLARAARAYLQRCRSWLLERHRQGAGGWEIVSAYTTMVDHLVRRLFEVASQDYIQRYPSLNPRCALIAQGGYGRGELNPHSDIDLLFLHTWKVTPYVESVAEKVLYTLWDAGLEVGHATRSIAESIRMAGKDLKIRTSLLDARYLCGDQALYSEFEKAVEEHLVRKSQDRFIREKLEESRLRHERYGGSVYILEPDIKESEGGLRDIHAALWIGKLRHRVRGLDDLPRHGVISEKDLAELKGAQDFLWRVRNELHFTSKKHQDQLTFEEQDLVAQALGFTDGDGKKGVEAFMRSYYLHAAEVSRVSSLIIHRLTDHTDGSQGRGRSGREIREGISVTRTLLSVTIPSILASHPENLIAVFADAQRHGVQIGHDTRELIRQHLDFIDERFRRSPTVTAMFLQILKHGERVYETLSEMHRVGVLGALIPEFERLLCMALHDLYHIYTVDQHSLRLVRELERLKAGEFRDALPLFTQLARETEKIEILYLGLLFHDIGKGLGGGHSEKGREIARKIARQMRLNVDEAVQLEFLVRRHLFLAHTAFRRDIEDEKLVIDFARTVGNVSNLKMLYLLTYVDMQAVGPQVWNPWKASLLEDLYLHTLRVLESQEKGEFQREDRQSRVRRIQARVRRRLSRHYAAERIRGFFQTMPERYFLTTPEEEIPSHFELMEQFRDQVYLSTVRHLLEKEYSEVVICTRDRPGLFACITGVFAAMGLDILSARINTRKDGLILDVFRISHMGRPEMVMNPEKWDRVRTLLGRVLSGSIDVARLVEESGRPSLFKRRPPKVPTYIQIDNDASDDFTIIEVYTQDRIGVLFTITYQMHQLGLSIHLAKISTNVDQVADVFYVTDERGGKIHDPEQLEAIRQNLYQSLVEENEGIAQPAS